MVFPLPVGAEMHKSFGYTHELWLCLRINGHTALCTGNQSVTPASTKLPTSCECSPQRAAEAPRLSGGGAGMT